jgi:predicted nucleic acid-binding protein
VAVDWRLSVVRTRERRRHLGDGRAPMILVDTSIRIDHLRAVESGLLRLLTDDEIGTHPLVIEELALGSIRKREGFLGLLSNLYQFPTVSHFEILHLVQHRRLWGKGLSAIDVHLLGSVALVGGAQLWTRDKRLKAACESANVVIFNEA